MPTKYEPHRKRSRFFIDSKVQGTLVLRAALYWAYAILALSLMILVCQMALGPARISYLMFEELWIFYGKSILASTLLLPIMLVDVVKLSNRFVGPLLRLRRGLRALSQGEAGDRLKFRDGDYWPEIASEFNALSEYVERLQRELAEARRAAHDAGLCSAATPNGECEAQTESAAV